MANGGTGTNTGPSLKITGQLDDTGIRTGFTRVKQGFMQVKSEGASFGADMERASKSVSGLATKLAVIGTAGVTALVGLATKAPAVAGSVARIQVQTERLSRAVGVALAPAFEKMAGLMERVAGIAEANPDLIRGLAFTGVSLAGVGALTKLFGTISAAGPVLTNPLFATALGLLTAAGGRAIGEQKLAETIDAPIEAVQTGTGAIMSFAGIKTDFFSNIGSIIGRLIASEDRREQLLGWWDQVTG